MSLLCDWLDESTDTLLQKQLNSILKLVLMEKKFRVCRRPRCAGVYGHKEGAGGRLARVCSTFGVCSCFERLFLIWRVLICWRKQQNLSWDQCYTRSTYPTKKKFWSQCCSSCHWNSFHLALMDIWVSCRGRSEVTNPSVLVSRRGRLCRSGPLGGATEQPPGLETSGDSHTYILYTPASSSGLNTTE